MRFLFLGLLSIFSLTTSYAQQTAILKGVVVETTNRGAFSPINGAIIYWKGTFTAVSSDSNGTFQIALNKLSRQLVVLATGYKTDTIIVNDTNSLKVILVSKTQLGEALISYERRSSEVSFIDPWKTTIMNEKELFKAACCNLSESFETNPSVDVAYADALSGTKQLQMLGLSGQYLQVSMEQIPGLRSIASTAGLSTIPGAWINSIQVSKGVSAIVSGYESISGQINIELHKPDVKDKFLFNAYVGEGGRYELNAVVPNKIGERFSQSVLAHVNLTSLRMDRNQDGYLDNPLGNQVNLMYRFKIDTKKNWVINGAIQGVSDKRFGGENNFDPAAYVAGDTLSPYGIQTLNERVYAFGKVGYIFPKKKYKSVGLQLNYTNQKLSNTYGITNYDAKQNWYYGNLIYQSIINNTNHRFRTGITFSNENTNEAVSRFRLFSNTSQFKRTEQVLGAYFEYTYTWYTKFTLVAGLRADNHNLFGNYITPRLHLRYALNENFVLRASAGKGWRTANIFAENSSLFISSRKFNWFNTNLNQAAYGFKPEEAWNFGLNLIYDFKLNYRKGTFSADYYFTQFSNRVIVDRDMSFDAVMLYQQLAFSSGLQLQLDYSPLRRLDVRIAYRFYDVQSKFIQGWSTDPMLAKHRGFVNLAYQTKSKWAFDFTSNLIGAKRLPRAYAVTAEKQSWSDFSLPFWLFNGQITKSYKKRVDVYLGCENIFDFKQLNPIVNSSKPYSSTFDATLIWGPVFGRMIYGGIRWRL